MGKATHVGVAASAAKWRSFNWATLAGVGVVLLIAAHVLVLWGSITWSIKIGWLPWSVSGSLLAFGLYHVIRHIRGHGHGHSHFGGGQAHEHGDVEHGPHQGSLVNLGHGFIEITIVDTDAQARFRLFFYDTDKRPRAVPRHATVTIETVRPDETRHTFAFHAKSEYLESTTEISGPRDFKAIVHVSHGSHSHPPREVHFSEHRQARHVHRT